MASRSNQGQKHARREGTAVPVLNYDSDESTAVDITKNPIGPDGMRIGFIRVDECIYPVAKPTQAEVEREAVKLANCILDAEFVPALAHPMSRSGADRLNDWFESFFWPEWFAKKVAERAPALKLEEQKLAFLDEAVARQWEFTVRGRIIPIAQVAKILIHQAREKQAYKDMLNFRINEVFEKGPQDSGIFKNEAAKTGFLENLDMEELKAKLALLPPTPTAPIAPKPAHVRYDRREAMSEI